MYAGINVKSKQLVAMLISGLIAGLLGAMIYCGQTNNLFITTATKAIPTRGFDGISVGLISMNNPVAVLPISLFFAMIENAKSTIQAECSVDPVVADLMFGVIVYGAAIISLVCYFRP
jgi:simple sugar transport system permease protein